MLNKKWIIITGIILLFAGFAISSIQPVLEKTPDTEIEIPTDIALGECEICANIIDDKGTHLVSWCEPVPNDWVADANREATTIIQKMERFKEDAEDHLVGQATYVEIQPYFTDCPNYKNILEEGIGLRYDTANETINDYLDNPVIQKDNDSTSVVPEKEKPIDIGGGEL